MSSASPDCRTYTLDDFTEFIDAVESLREQMGLIHKSKVDPAALTKLKTIEVLLDLVLLDIEESVEGVY